MLNAILIGVGATALMDLAAVVRARFGAPFPDYGLVGRWIAHAARGQPAQKAIAQAAPVSGEAAIGWTAHYVIGVAYAALLLLAFPGWDAEPTLAPALQVGVGTVLAPFLIMQPGMGMGFFAARTPKPNVVRLRSLVTHATFGLGLYVAGLVRLLVLP